MKTKLSVLLLATAFAAHAAPEKDNKTTDKKPSAAQNAPVTVVTAPLKTNSKAPLEIDATAYIVKDLH
ncbi:hypothetical protein [Alysiella crassa]|uniref:Uncharacterized protein n=1 Tax=Alysiella crassa TaxID=153491 RepID=A0A376BUE7_9NEIS|nr:Uncharacterised protein [Alysiella crassa]